MESEFAHAYPATTVEGVGPGTEAPPERRRSDRQHYRAAAWLSPEAETRNGKQRQVFVNSLSLHGAGFTASTRLELGAVHWLVVGAGALRASSRVRVVTCRADSGGGFQIGAEFF